MSVLTHCLHILLDQSVHAHLMKCMAALHMVPCTCLPAATITSMLCTAASGALVFHVLGVMSAQNLSKCVVADLVHPGASQSPVRLSDVHCTLAIDIC